MDSDPLIVNVEESELVQLDERQIQPVGSLSEVWTATEALFSPSLTARLSGFKRLNKAGAPRQYPLVAYVLATRLLEPDIQLRARIVTSLAEVISGSKRVLTNSRVYKTVTGFLAGLRTRQIYSLLQVVEFDRSKEESVAELLSYCSFAGVHLAQILSNRETPLEIRRQAARFIGRIGYLDALPTLERLANRLEERKDGGEASLYPVLQEAIQSLRSP